MINLYPSQIESVSLHRVGNKSKAEPMFLSSDPYNPDDETRALLKEFFFRPFREKEENYYRLAHEADLEFNPVYALVSKIFDNPSETHIHSQDVTRHLYEQSGHPHIKSGEVYVAYFTDVLLDNKKVDAVGIFKSELKHDFLLFEETSENLNIRVQQGINLNKLDKGCIIFNTLRSEGYKVLSVDSNRYDAKY
jgi:hypothetical protein